MNGMRAARREPTVRTTLYAKPVWQENTVPMQLRSVISARKENTAQRTKAPRALRARAARYNQLKAKPVATTARLERPSLQPGKPAAWYAKRASTQPLQEAPCAPNAQPGSIRTW